MQMRSLVGCLVRLHKVTHYDNSLQQPRLIAFGEGPQTRSVNDADSWRRILAEGQRGK